jgi:hypothetical protein
MKTDKTQLKRRTLLAAAASALGLLAAPSAEAVAPAPALVDLEVIDRETGEAARVWRHAGRMYVAGRPGARYGLRVSNNTGGRVMVVMSVDGVNVITGQTASYNQNGYVFEPYQSYEVSGWRKSDREVAAFTFAPLPRSYAARTGRPDDVGVIGIAAFREKVRRPLAVAPPPVVAQSRGRADYESAQEAVEESGRAAAAPVAAPPPRSARLGTGHGARERSEVVNVSFERATAYPQYVHRLEYDSHANLVAAGVIPRTRPATPQRPRPFPGNGYVPDPPGYR